MAQKCRYAYGMAFSPKKFCPSPFTSVKQGIGAPSGVNTTLSPFIKSKWYSPGETVVSVALPNLTVGFFMSVRSRQGSPSRLSMRMLVVFPPWRVAETRKAPSVLKSLNDPIN